MRTQRSDTNTKLKALKSSQKEWTLSKEMHKEFKEFEALFFELESMRSKVDSLSASVPDLLKYYEIEMKLIQLNHKLYII